MAQDYIDPKWAYCEYCIYDDEPWDSVVCDGCVCGENEPSNFERKNNENNRC